MSLIARARTDDVGCVHYISTEHSCDVGCVLMEIKLTRSDQSRRAHFSEHFIYNDNSPYLTCLRNNVSKMTLGSRLV